MSTRFGACVASARLHARLGSPMPTKTMSPSRSSAAAAHIITVFSAAPSAPVRFRFSAVALIAIVHAGTQSLLGDESRREAGMFGEIFAPIADAEHEFVEISLEPPRVLRDFFPADVELVVAVIVPLRVRRVRAPRLMNDRVDDEA